MQSENEGVVSSHSKQKHSVSASPARVLTSSPRINIASSGELFMEGSLRASEDRFTHPEGVFVFASRDSDRKIQPNEGLALAQSSNEPDSSSFCDRRESSGSNSSSNDSAVDFGSLGNSRLACRALEYSPSPTTTPTPTPTPTPTHYANASVSGGGGSLSVFLCENRNGDASGSSFIGNDGAEASADASAISDEAPGPLSPISPISPISPHHHQQQQQQAIASQDTSGAGAAAETETETDAQRIAREIAESERLAYEMMREEAQSAYDMQMEFMRANADSMSAEDYAALQAAVGMGAADLPSPGAAHARRVLGAREEGNEGEAAGSDVSQESDVSGASDASSGWRDPNNYEQLLALSSQIGDVKTERWRLRARAVIDSLPRIRYSEILKLSQPAMADKSTLSVSESSTREPAAKRSVDEDESSSSMQPKDAKEHRDRDTTESASSNPRKRLCLRTIDSHCSVCMDPFLPSSAASTGKAATDTGAKTGEGEEEGDGVELLLPLLPCSHYVHDDCLRGWMADNNSCPVCRVEVSPSSTL